MTLFSTGSAAPVLAILVGPPASGKSSYLRGGWAFVVLSSDAIRLELTGDMSDQTKNGLVFHTLHERILENLEMRRSVVVDATNVRPSSRAEIHRLGVLAGAERFVAHRFDVPLPELELRNAQRERQVPLHALRRMYQQFQHHCSVEQLESEGWVVYNHA